MCVFEELRLFYAIHFYHDTHPIHYNGTLELKLACIMCCNGHIIVGRRKPEVIEPFQPDVALPIPCYGCNLPLIPVASLRLSQESRKGGQLGDQPPISETDDANGKTPVHNIVRERKSAGVENSEREPDYTQCGHETNLIKVLW